MSISETGNTSVWVTVVSLFCIPVLFAGNISDRGEGRS